VVPLDLIERELQETQIDLAVNICNFSGCMVAAISWWLDMLASHRIRYVFIVPDALHYGGTRLMTEPAGGSTLRISSW
jgi:hypothetical protein